MSSWDSNPALDRALAEMSGAPRGPSAIESVTFGATLELVSGPTIGVEPTTYDPNRPAIPQGHPFYRRRRERKRGPDAIFEGRACCQLLAATLQRRAHQLRLPHDESCLTCGAKWRLAVRARQGAY